MSSRLLERNIHGSTMWGRFIAYLRERRRSMLHTPVIVSTPGVMGGRPHIKGRRITVAQILSDAAIHNLSVEQVLDEYSLTVGELGAVVDYYVLHRKQIEESIRADAKLAADIQSTIPSRLPRP